MEGVCLVWGEVVCVCVVGGESKGGSLLSLSPFLFFFLFPFYVARSQKKSKIYLLLPNPPFPPIFLRLGKEY